jgi:hypothetical protein
VPALKSIHHRATVSDTDLPSTDPTPGCSPKVSVARLTALPQMARCCDDIHRGAARGRNLSVAIDEAPPDCRKQSRRKHGSTLDNRSANHGCWRLTHVMREARQCKADGAFEDNLIMVRSRAVFTPSKRSTSYGLQAWLFSRCMRTTSLSPRETVAKHFTQNESTVPSLFRRRQKCRSLGEEVSTLAPYHSCKSRRTRKTDRLSRWTLHLSQLLKCNSSSNRSMILVVRSASFAGSRLHVFRCQIDKMLKQPSEIGQHV